MENVDVELLNNKQTRKERFARKGEREKLGKISRDRWCDPEFKERESQKRRGENNGRAVLTEDNVRIIRAEYDVLQKNMVSKRHSIVSGLVR